MPRVRDAVKADIQLIEYRATEEAIAELAAELDRRQSSGAVPVFGAVRARRQAARRHAGVGLARATGRAAG